MTEHAQSIAPFYQGWDTYQQQIVLAIAPLTHGQLRLAAGPGLRPVGMNAAHIASTRAGWLHYVLQVADDRLLEFLEWGDRERPIPPAAELVRALEVTWQVIAEQLATWTIANLDDEFWDTDEQGNPEGPIRRQWVIWHLIEHDVHHGGEISLLLGSHGLPAVDI